MNISLLLSENMFFKVKNKEIQQLFGANWPDALQVSVQLVGVHRHLLALLGWRRGDHLQLQVVVHLVRLRPRRRGALRPTTKPRPQRARAASSLASLPLRSLFVLHHSVVWVHVLIAVVIVFFLLLFLLNGLLGQVDQVSWRRRAAVIDQDQCESFKASEGESGLLCVFLPECRCVYGGVCPMLSPIRGFLVLMTSLWIRRLWYLLFLRRRTTNRRLLKTSEETESQRL